LAGQCSQIALQTLGSVAKETTVTLITDLTGTHLTTLAPISDRSNSPGTADSDSAVAIASTRADVFAEGLGAGRGVRRVHIIAHVDNQVVKVEVGLEVAGEKDQDHGST